MTVSLFDDDELITSKSVNVSPSDIQKISFENLDVHPWSAECPYLYEVRFRNREFQYLPHLLHKFRIRHTNQEMETDISLVKQYNANCFRTSHYPPDPAFQYV